MNLSSNLATTGEGDSWWPSADHLVVAPRRNWCRIALFGMALVLASGCRHGGAADEPVQAAAPREAVPADKANLAFEDALIASVKASHEVPWSVYEIRGHIRDPDIVPERGLYVVTNEEEYRRRFEAPSSIDWSRFRLVVYRAAGIHSIEGVVRDKGDYVLVLRFRMGPTDFVDEVFTVLIPAGTERVRVFRVRLEVL
jgi:hypothetical protein